MERTGPSMMKISGLLPLGQEGVTSRVEAQVELARWSSGNALIVGLAVTVLALWAVIWMYRRERRGEVSRQARWLLASCRCGLLVILGLIGLEPVLARYVHRQVDAYTLILLDTSASMALVDRYRDARAAERAARVLGGPAAAARRGVARHELVQRIASAPWFDRLRESNRVRAFGFADGLAEFAPPTTRPTENPSSSVDAASPVTTAATNGVKPSDDEAGPSLILDPRGPATDLGQAVRQALSAVGGLPSAESGGAPIAAIVLLTDGNFNAGDPAQTVEQFLASKGIPVMAVGVGDPSPPVNVRVAEVTGPRMVFKDDPFQITVQLSAEGLEDRPIEMELLEKVRSTATASSDASHSAGGEARVVERRTVRPKPGGSFDPVLFERQVKTAGEVTYVARVPRLEEETIRTDNERETVPAVRVLEARMRVLLVAGGPSFEYRFLSRLLIRDSSVDVSCWLQSADERAVREGNTIIDHLPGTGVNADAARRELLAFDAVVLLDPSPEEIPAEWFRILAERVTEHGVGLLYQAGPKFVTEFFRRGKTTPLLEVLPVVPDTEAELLLHDLGIYQRTPWRMLVPPETAGSPLLQVADDPRDSLRFLTGLEGVFWHYPVRREKAAATVLLRHANPRMVNAAGPHVLMATQFVGAGRSAFLAFDDTWRWRRFGENRFDRFWIQALRFLVEGKFGGGRLRVTLLTDRDRFTVGEPIVVTARLLNENLQPLQRPSAELTVAGDAPGSRNIVLDAVVDRPGYYQGRVSADRPGRLRLSLALPGGGDDARAERTVEISQPDLEMTNPVLREETLRGLCERTGGRYFDLDRADELPAAIENRRETTVIRERPRSLWDNGYVLTVLIGLLTVEWITRRVTKLL